MATHESLRWPLLVRWTALAALVAKGGETRDGEYQRGRIVGYLAANQGCHLSALVRGLGFGNHQATHHLRILQSRGLIWHRRDGRRLRFYTSDVPSDTTPDDLPVPELIAAPDSVLMDLLRTLSEAESRPRPPSQSDLARALGCSQPLISHHLRTLHQHGLVDSRRDGLRTRHAVSPRGLEVLAGADMAGTGLGESSDPDDEDAELEAEIEGALLPEDLA